MHPPKRQLVRRYGGLRGVVVRALFGVALGLAGWTHQAQAQDITIVYGDGYKPFAWGKGLDARGVQRDFVERVLVDKMGLKVRHEVLPWRRAQNYVRDGERDGFFTVPTDERSAFTEASALPFYETQFVMHTVRHSPHIDALRAVRSLNDLEALRDLRHIHMLGSGWHEAALKRMHSVERATRRASRACWLG